MLARKSFYSAHEVAEITGLTVQTIYRHIGDSSLRGMKVGKRRWVISHEALVEYLGVDFIEAGGESSLEREVVNG